MQRLSGGRADCALRAYTGDTLMPMANSVLGAAGRTLLAVPPIELCYRTFKETQADDATHMAAGVAYYAILSLFPLALGVMAVFAPLIQTQDAQGQVLAFAETYLPGATDALGANLVSGAGARGAQGALSLIGLFWAASALFGAISRAVNRAWDVHHDRPFYIAKLRHIVMALSVGFLFFSSVVITSTLHFLNVVYLPVFGEVELVSARAAQWLARLLPFAFSLGIFLLIFKFVPNTKTHWRFVWPGAALTALMFEIGKSLFVFYVATFADYSRVYGALGSIVVLQVWVYVSALVLIVGAEFTSEYGRMAMGVSRGQTIASARGAR